MDGEPNIATVAALIGDTGRAAMLAALLGGSLATINGVRSLWHGGLARDALR